MVFPLRGIRERGEVVRCQQACYLVQHHLADSAAIEAGDRGAHSLRLDEHRERGVPAPMALWGLSSLEEYFVNTPSSILFLADATYATYLFHVLCLQAPAIIMDKKHWPHPWLAWLLSIVVGLSAGALVHGFIEDPMNRKLRRSLRLGSHGASELKADSTAGDAGSDGKGLQTHAAHFTQA